jgi:uncharacterized membrane protein YhaH (DUF805 family)
MAQKYCSSCGTELREGSVFCSNCGTSIERPVVRNREIRGIFDYYKEALRKYADFSGRASVREFWMFVVGNLIIGFLGGIAVLILAILIGLGSRNYILGALVYMIIAGGYGLYIIIPSISIAVRRLHDQDKSGAFYFITFIPYIGPIIILIFMCLQGNLGVNQYGDVSEF